jgi:hypothetical protein
MKSYSSLQDRNKIFNTLHIESYLVIQNQSVSDKSERSQSVAYATDESERSHSVADSYSIMSLQAQSGVHVYI